MSAGKFTMIPNARAGTGARLVGPNSDNPAALARLIAAKDGELLRILDGVGWLRGAANARAHARAGALRTELTALYSRLRAAEIDTQYQAARERELIARWGG